MMLSTAATPTVSRNSQLATQNSPDNPYQSDSRLFTLGGFSGLTVLVSNFFEPDRIRQEYERRLHGSDETTTRKQLKSRLQKTSGTIGRLIDAYEEGMLSKDEFEPRIRASKRRLEELKEQQSSATTRQDEQRELRLVMDHLEDFHQRISENLESIDWKTKREIIRSLVKRVKIDNTNVRVIYKMSPPPASLSGVNRENLQNCSRRVG